MGKWPSLDKIEMDRRSDRQGRLRRPAREAAAPAARPAGPQPADRRPGPDRHRRLGRRRQGRPDRAPRRRRWSRNRSRSGASGRRRPRSRAATTSGASGTACRRPATGRSSTAPGTAASWSSASRASAARTPGSAPIARSTSSSASSPTTACASSSSWSMSSAEEQKRRMIDAARASPTSTTRSGWRISATSPSARQYHRGLRRHAGAHRHRLGALARRSPSDNKMRARLKGLRIVDDIVGKGVDQLEPAARSQDRRSGRQAVGLEAGRERRRTSITDGSALEPSRPRL